MHEMTVDGPNIAALSSPVCYRAPLVYAYFLKSDPSVCLFIGKCFVAKYFSLKDPGQLPGISPAILEARDYLLRIWWSPFREEIQAQLAELITTYQPQISLAAGQDRAASPRTARSRLSAEQKEANSGGRAQGRMAKKLQRQAVLNDYIAEGLTTGSGDVDHLLPADVRAAVGKAGSVK